MKDLAGKKILVTGGTGFVGSPLCERLAGAGAKVRTASVEPAEEGDNHFCDVRSDKGWPAACEGIDIVVHLAARVHVMNETSQDPLADFRETNRDGTMRVAEHAIRAGIRRFLFLSTIKVLGEGTKPGAPFNAESPLNPEDPYSISKAEAEEVLMENHRAGDLEAIIIRPPLIHGPGVGGNLASLARLVRKGIPLPFASIRNRRDLAGVNNLCDLIERASTHPQAPGNRFLVSDGEAVSTPDLIRTIAAALDLPPRLLPVPPACLRTALKVMGRGPAWGRLSGNLEVDISETGKKLGWEPPVTFAKGIQLAFGTP